MNKAKILAQTCTYKLVNKYLSTQDTVYLVYLSSNVYVPPQKFTFQKDVQSFDQPVLQYPIFYLLKSCQGIGMPYSILNCSNT